MNKIFEISLQKRLYNFDIEFIHERIHLKFKNILLRCKMFNDIDMR